VAAQHPGLFAGEEVIVYTELRDYQTKALEDINRLFADHEKVVLASAPGSGKTVIAIEFIKQNPSLKVMILPHGTNVLKTQWHNQLTENNVSFSITDFSSQVIVALPQSLYNKDLPKVDLLIVDEAHEFYFAENMVQGIINKVRPAKQLLLTGTPSKFILANKTKREYNLVVIDGLTLVEQGFMSNLYSAAVTTSEPIKKTDYNSVGDLKGKYSFTRTEETLDRLLDAMYRRLRMSKHIKSDAKFITEWPELAQISGKISSVFSEFGKTLVACHSISQATEVYNYFQNKGIESVLSHSENDIDSKEITKFQDNATVKVLVVVNRAILGFDFPELVNVVDLSCSKNIDRTYQMLSRVVRKHPMGHEKFFFKIVPDAEKDLNKFVLTAAHCLMNRSFLERFDGKNLNHMEIPVLLKKLGRKIIENNDEKPESEGKVASKRAPIDTDFYDEVMSTNLLIDLFNKSGEVFSEYAFVTMGKLRETFLGEMVHDPDGKKLTIRTFHAERGRFPSQYSKNSVEKKLGDSLAGYCSPSQCPYDSEFSAWARGLGYGADTSGSRKEKIKAFHAEHGRFPSQSSKDLIEKKLWKGLSSYCSPKGDTYDLEFHTWARGLGYGADTSGPNKEKIKAFHAEHGRFPSRYSKNSVEKKLGRGLVIYCSSSRNSYDLEFSSWARDLGYGADTSGLKKEKIKAFHAEHGRFPSQSSKDSTEVKLRQGLTNYCSPSHGSYDLEFDTWARGLGFGADTSGPRKEKIKAFHSTHGRFPSHSSKDSVEKKLWRGLSHYCSPASSSYDSEFHTWARDLGYGADTSGPRKEKIKAFHAEHGRFPSYRSKDSVEKKLGKGLGSYCSPASGTYDLEFSAWARGLGYGADTSGPNKEKIKAFHTEHGRFPSGSSKDLIEKKLGKGLADYCSHKSRAYDSEFATWARSKGYGSRNRGRKS